MSIKRWAAKRDANERAILEAYERVHAEVVALPDAPCDLFVGWAGRWVGVEIKSGSGALTERQKAFRDRCQVKGLPFYVIRSVEDALQAIGAIH